MKNGTLSTKPVIGKEIETLTTLKEIAYAKQGGSNNESPEAIEGNPNEY